MGISYYDQNIKNISVWCGISSLSSESLDSMQPSSRIGHRDLPLTAFLRSIWALVEGCNTLKLFKTSSHLCECYSVNFHGFGVLKFGR